MRTEIKSFNNAILYNALFSTAHIVETRESKNP